MAVTPTHDLPGRRLEESERPQPEREPAAGGGQREESGAPMGERRDETGSQNGGQPEGEDGLRTQRQGQDVADDQSDSQSAGKSKGMRILGGVGVFVVVALYFVWIGSEMGGAALSGTTEMVAIFGAIVLGILALLAGGALSRKTDSEEHEKH